MTVYVYEVVKKLIGPIKPMGEVHTDDARLYNLKNCISLINALMDDIFNIAREKDRVEASIKRAGEEANGFLKNILCSLEEDTSLCTDSGLMWSMSSESIMDWDDAMNYAKHCVEDGYTDWRLPTRAEIISLIDDTKYDPACKDSNMKSEGYWSSTTCAALSSYAWSVRFNHGHVSYRNKSNHYYVRCVRTV